MNEPNTTPTTLEAALSYAAVGWRVIPLHSPGVDAPCDCNRPDCDSPAKHPRIKNWQRRATTNADQIMEWFGAMWPHANVGIVTGAGSRLIVLDVDAGHAGYETLGALEQAHGPLPDTPRVSTGSGGEHYYFSHPGTEVRNSASRLGPGLDIRGDGGFVVAPPSRHVSGGRYEWK